MPFGLTCGRIAELLSVPTHRVEWIIQSRGITPLCRVGTTRIFVDADLEYIRSELRRRRREAEAEAGHAAGRLARLVSGMTPVAESDADHVRAAADTFADAVERLKALEQFARDLRALLM